MSKKVLGVMFELARYKTYTWSQIMLCSLCCWL